MSIVSRSFSDDLKIQMLREQIRPGADAYKLASHVGLKKSGLMSLMRRKGMRLSLKKGTITPNAAP